MAKIIKLTEQDLYRIVKRVLNEDLIKENTIDNFKECVTSNLTFVDYAKIALVLLQCPSCGEALIRTGIGVLNEKGSSTTAADKVITVVLNDPEIKKLSVGCGSELLKYYTTLSQEEKTSLQTKVMSMMKCFAEKVFQGEINPMDVPGLPDQSDIPGLPNPLDIPGMEDMINKGTEMVKTGIDSVIKNMPIGNSPVMRSR
jgi:hypothetical protein